MQISALFYASHAVPACSGLSSMVVGTSVLASFDIDGAVGMYSGIFNNPFLIWGRYRRRWFRTTLTISFQFHHTQMDGAHAACFLDMLQKEIDTLTIWQRSDWQVYYCNAWHLQFKLDFTYVPQWEYTSWLNQPPGIWGYYLMIFLTVLWIFVKNDSKCYGRI